MFRFLSGVCVSADEAKEAKIALAKATTDAAKLRRQLDRINAAFLCSICCTNNVDTVLVPCGHMLCTNW